MFIMTSYSLLLITHVFYIHKQIVGIVLFYMVSFSFFLFFFFYFQRFANKMHFKPQLTINKHVFKFCTKDLKPRGMSSWRLNLFSCQKVKNLHIRTASTACMHFGKRVYFIFTTCTENSYNFAQNSLGRFLFNNSYSDNDLDFCKGNNTQTTVYKLCKIKTINNCT